MPYLVSGTSIYHHKLGNRPPFEFDTLPTVKASGTGRSYGAAIHNAEHALVKQANHPDAIIDVKYDSVDRDAGVECLIEGTPVKRRT